MAALKVSEIDSIDRDLEEGVLEVASAEEGAAKKAAIRRVQGLVHKRGKAFEKDMLGDIDALFDGLKIRIY